VPVKREHPVTTILDAGEANVSEKAERFREQMRSPMKARAFFLAKLPLAWFAGLKLRRTRELGLASSEPPGA